MVWSTPKTWTSGYVVLASDLNTYIKNQQLETAPAKVTAQGDIVYASGANALARLAKDTNSTRSLTNTGGSNNPAWAQVALATGVSGTLPVGNGGTGQTSLTANGVLVGNGSSAIAVTATMETKGHLLAGDGSGAPSMLGVGDDDQVLTADSGETTGLKWAAATAAPITSQIVTYARTAAAGAGAQPLTGAGFQPTAVIFLSKGPAITYSVGFGDVGDDQAYSALRSASGGAISATYCISIHDGTDSMQASLTSLDADGCTINWTKGGSGLDTDSQVLYLR